MRRIKGIIICIIAAAFISSCKQDETLRYNNLTMGNIVNGTFVSDQGNIFNVVEKTCEGNLEEMERALVICDVLKLKPGTENQYDVRLNGISYVLLKDAISRNAADSEEESSVSDPIHIYSAWISGGYLNMYLMYERVKTSNTKHLVNLVIEDTDSENGKFTFSLRHNSFGESLIYELEDEKQIELAGAFVSFPLTEIITDDSAEITVKWNWYKDPTPNSKSEIQEVSGRITYTKGGFEQAPVTLPSKATDKLN